MIRIGTYYVNEILYLNALTNDLTGATPPSTTKGTIYITYDGAGVQSFEEKSTGRKQSGNSNDNGSKGKKGKKCKKGNDKNCKDGKKGSDDENSSDSSNTSNDSGSNTVTYAGSKEISGKGPHAPEALILGFDMPVEAREIDILLKRYEDGASDESVKLVLNYSDSSVYTYDSTYIEDIFSPAAGQLFIDFSDLGVPEGDINSIEVWAEYNTDSHFVVNMVTYDQPNPIPEPTTLVLLGTGLMGIGLARKRKKS